MAEFVKVIVKREVLSNTSLGVGIEETFRFPLDDKKHEVEFMELKCNFQVTSFKSDLSEAIIETNYGKVEYEKGGFMNHCATKKPPRFLFFVNFELVSENFTSQGLDGYKLKIKESAFRGDAYWSKEKKKNYSLAVKLNQKLFLENIEKELVITGVDSEKEKVSLDIGGVEVIVTPKESGEYRKGGQSGYNDSFEAWSNVVTVELEKK